MQLELKNVKYLAYKCDKSEWFQGTIYIDGVKAAEVENSGMGT